MRLGCLHSRPVWCSSSLSTAPLNSFPVTSVTLAHPYRRSSGFVRRSNPRFFFMGLRKKECALSSGRERELSCSWQPLTTLPFVSISSASQRSGMQMRLVHTIGSRQSTAEGPWPESAQPGCMSFTHGRQNLGAERSEGVF